MASILGKVTGLTLGAGIVGVGGYAASRTWASHKDDELEDRLGNSAAMGVRAGLGATAAIGLTAISGKMASGSLKSTFSQPVSSLPGVKSLSEAFSQKTVKDAVGKLPIIKNIPNPMKTWKNIGPVGRVGAIGIASAAIAVGSKAMMGHAEYGSDDVASPDGYGDSNISQSNVRQRLNSIGASGDIVFGLNNKR